MNRQRLVKIGIIVLTFLGVVGIVAVWGIILTIIFSLGSATQDVTDIKRYQEIRSEFDPSRELTKHFPNNIPTDATNAYLFYSPGSFRNFTIFELKIKLPANRIKSLESQYRPLAKRRYKRGDKNNSPTEYTCSSDYANITITYDYHCHTCGDTNSSFPPTYEILVLEDSRGEPDCITIHGAHSGVAIDSSTSQIVYWVVDW